MTVASSALALLALPTLDPDALPYVAGLVALAAVAVLGRAVLSALRLGDAAKAIDGASVRLEAGRPRLADSFADLRTRLTGMHTAVERQMWSLPQVDRSMAMTGARLANLRAGLDEWRRPGGEGLGRTLSAIRGTLTVLKTADRFRRVIQR